MKIDKFKNVSMVSNLDGLISIFCDHEKRGSEYYHEYLFLDNDTHEIKAHFASTGCLSVEQLHKGNETLFLINETLLMKNRNKKYKLLIVNVNPDLSYEVLHEIEKTELGIKDGTFAICKNVRTKYHDEPEGGEWDLESDSLENELWGFIDENGIEFIKPQYEYYFPFACGIAGVYKFNKWGLINKQNDLIIPYEYNDIRRIQEYKNKTYINLKKRKWGIIDSNNNVVIPFEYEEIGSIGECIPVILNKKLGFIDINNIIVVPFIYEPVENVFCDIYCDLPQYKLIGKNGLIGLFDTKNLKEVIPCEYKKLKVDDNGIVAQKQNDKFVVLNSDNEELSPEFERIKGRREGLFTVYSGEDSAFMNNQGEILTPFTYQKHTDDFKDGLCIAEHADYEKGIDVINKEGKVLYHADKYRDVFNAGNGYILAENQDGEFEFKKLI